MANEIPLPPNLTCPVPQTGPEAYYTDSQSILNVTRKDKFKLVMDIPNVLKPLLQQEERRCHGGSLDRLQFSVWGYVVPKFEINKLEKPYAGQTLKFSNLSRPSYPPVTVNFTVDNKFDNYFVIYKWLDLQNDETFSQFDGKKIFDNPSAHLCEYASTFTVYALDEYEKTIAKWDYIGAFPTTLGEINASYRDTAELESNFSFEYSQVKMSLL